MGERCSCGADAEPTFLDHHPLLLRLLGLAALLVAVGMIYDGWFVVGAFGLALLTGHVDGATGAVRQLLRRNPSR